MGRRGGEALTHTPEMKPPVSRGVSNPRGHAHIPVVAILDFRPLF